MNFKSHFLFTRSERNGLMLLAALILSLQLIFHFADFSHPEPDSPERRQWLALQSGIDSMKRAVPEKPRHYPFNPNFITDFKGYQLGMSVDEIDRLHEFRKSGKYVNSAEEFRQVTKVSDSLLAAISPYFKFPDWVGKRRQMADGRFQAAAGGWQTAENRVAVKDINSATKEDLMAVYGIGDALSDRILKQKEALGGFVSMEQMQDVWGLSDDVVGKLKKQFKVAAVPEVKRVKVNDASVKELSQFPYFRYALAKEIVTYRSMNGKLSGIEDLAKIKNFPVEKSEIIALYLEF